jgi:hypothetical protein
MAKPHCTIIVYNKNNHNKINFFVYNLPSLWYSIETIILTDVGKDLFSLKLVNLYLLIYAAEQDGLYFISYILFRVKTTYFDLLHVISLTEIPSG